MGTLRKCLFDQLKNAFFISTEKCFQKRDVELFSNRIEFKFGYAIYFQRINVSVK